MNTMRRVLVSLTVALWTMPASVGQVQVTSTSRCNTDLSGNTTCAAEAAQGPSDLQDLIDNASPGDTILVPPGVYSGSLDFGGKFVTLRSTDGPETTTIMGDGGTAIDIGPGGALVGFTVTGGAASFGAGMNVRGFGTLIENNVFEANMQFAGGFGAAIGGNGASPTIIGNVFRFNTCDNQFLSGVVSFVNSSSPVIANNVFVDNSCRAINMTLPVGNQPVVVNNTMVRNRVGVRVDRRISAAQQTYSNNIVFDNQIGLEIDFGSESNNPTWTHNLVFSNLTDYDVISDQTGINGNISAAPVFVSDSDFHLAPGSAAIDAGDNDAPGLPLLDFDGDERILDGVGDGMAVVDIGADEFGGGPSNAAPVADAGADRIAECSSSDGAQLVLDGSGSTDPDSTPGTNDDIVLFEWFEGFGMPSQAFLGSGEILVLTLPLGNHTITLRVTDSFGETGTDEVFLTIEDTTPPWITVGVTPDTLWPPNHHMVEITATVTASDNCGTPTIALASLTSNEVNDAQGKGDGRTTGDIQPGADDFHFSLRAERAGTGSGRIYTAVYAATDGSGNVTSEAAFVVVPHDQGGVIDPVEIALEQSVSGTVVSWAVVPDAESYDVIRGELNNVVETAVVINLGTVICIEANSTDESTLGWEDGELPGPGRAFFYVVEYYDGISSTYGTESAGKPRAPGLGDCQQ